MSEVRSAYDVRVFRGEDELFVYNLTVNTTHGQCNVTTTTPVVITESDEPIELRVQTAGHKGDSMTPHSHDFYELVFVHEGKARHCLGDNNYPVRAGDVFIIPPGVTHVYREANMGIYNMLFSKNFLKHFQQDMSGFPNYQLLFNIPRDLPLSHRLMSLDSAYFPEMTRLLDDIIHEQEAGGCGSRSAVLSDFLRVILLICRHSHPAGNPKNLHYAICM